MLGAAHDLGGDQRVQLAFGLVARAADRGALGGHGADRLVVQVLQERVETRAEVSGGGLLNADADGVAVGREQIGLHDQGGRRIRGRDGR